MRDLKIIVGILTCLVIFTTGALNAGPVPDTGIYQCYARWNGQKIACPGEDEPYFGQDGSYHINPPAFVKLDSQSRPVSDAFGSWTMVEDKITGLIWEVKTNDGSIHDQEQQYSFDQAGQFVNNLNTSQFGGKNNWRLPTLKELFYISHYGCDDTKTVILKDFFGPFRLSNRDFWTSTPGNTNLSRQYALKGYNAEYAQFSKDSQIAVRAVSGPVSGPDFRDNGNGTVTDRSSGLTWQKDALKVSGNYYSAQWMEAVDLCRELGFAGNNDWRLPSIKELVSILDFSRSDPALYSEFSSGGDEKIFWSSSINPDYTITGWVTDSDDGGNSFRFINYEYPVRAVRGGYTGLADIRLNVMDVNSGDAIDNAKVFLETVKTQTSSSGRALFNNVSGNNTYYIKVVAPGYVTYRVAVTLPEDPEDLDLDVNLVPGRTSGNPLVAGVQTAYGSGETLHFMEGIDFEVVFAANVDWGSKSQGRILFDKNGNIEGNYPGSIEYRSYNMGSFSGDLSVSARSADGVASPAVSVGIVMPPPPGFAAADFKLNNFGNTYTYTATVPASDDLITKLFEEAGVDVDAFVPMFGGHRLAAAAGVNLSVTVYPDGVAEYEFLPADESFVEAAGVRTTAGNSEWETDGTSRCVYGADGWQFEEGGQISSFLNHPVNLETLIESVPMGGVSLPLVFSPVLTAMIDSSNQVSDLVSGDQWQLEGLWTAKHSGTISAGNHLTGALTLESYLSYESLVEFDFEADPKFQGAFARYIQSCLATEMLFQSPYTIDYKWVETDPERGGLLQQPDAVMAGGFFIPRNDENSGSAAFGQNPSDAAIYCQQDVFPYSDPVMLQDASLMVWVGDDKTVADQKDRTALFFATNSESRWSAPKILKDEMDVEMAGPDFNPHLAGAGGDDAILVWQRASDNWGESLSDLQAAQEIWFTEYVNGSWSPEPVQLTDNGTYDHSPVAAAGDTSRLAVWINETPGKDQTIGYSFNTGQGWSEEIEAFNLPGTVTFMSLARHSINDEFFLALSVDQDRDLSTIGDQEIYTATFDGTDWSDPMPRTSNAGQQNTRPWLVKDSSEDLWVFWYSGGQIKAAENPDLSGAQTAGQPGVSAGGADFSVVPDRNGNFYVMWPKAVFGAQEISGLLFKPGNALAEPVMLTAGGGVKRSAAGGVGDNQNLILAYNHVVLEESNSDILLGQNTYTVTNYAPGSTDLCTNFHPMEKKLTLELEPAGAKGFSFTYNPQGSVQSEDGNTRYFHAGEEVTITPGEDEKWAFVRWEGDIGSANPSVRQLRLVMDDHKEIRAVFKERFELTTNVIGTGSGSIRVDPSGGWYEPGTPVNLTAVAAEDSIFDQWYGVEPKKEKETSVTIDMGEIDKSVTARFIKPYVLTRTVEPNEPKKGGNIIADPEGPYTSPTTVELTAVPNEGYEFVRWEGPVDGEDTDKIVYIDMDDNKSVIAYFNKIEQYQIHVTPSPSRDSGTVTQTPDQASYNPGDEVELTANPASGWTFIEWRDANSGAGLGSENPLKVTMNEDKEIIVYFDKLPEYTLTVENPSNGQIQPGTGTHPEGTRVRVEAVADEGFRFQSWTGDLSGTQNPAYITMDDDKTIGALFEAIAYQSLTVNVNGNGSVDPGSGQYEKNQAVRLTAVADPGYEFLGWQGDIPPEAANNPDLTGIWVIMTEDKTVTANFTGDLMYTLGVSVQGSGGVEMNPAGGQYNPGTEVELTAVADQGQVFEGWGGDLSGITENPFTVTMDANKDVTATFAEIPSYVLDVVIEDGKGSVIKDPPDGPYEAGTTVKLTADPDPGYRLSRWVVDDTTGSSPSVFVTMDSDKTVYVSFEENTPAAVLYFPHVECRNGWENEICVINTGKDNIEGSLEAYDENGLQVDIYPAALEPMARMELDVASGFDDPEQIRYIAFVTAAAGAGEALAGYTRFSKPGRYRAALPAFSGTNEKDVHIAHIACSANWWTGIGLVNTTDEDKGLIIEFNTGEIRDVELPPKGHRSFTISSLFARDDLMDLESAVIRNSSGVIGLELFGGANQLSGILLTEEAATELYYPHVTSEGDWWTGIVAYNPLESACDLTIDAYTQSGNSRGTLTIPLEGRQKYVGVAGNDLQLPAETDWFVIRAGHGVTGFELFGQPSQLGGFSAGRLLHRAGVFPSLEKDQDVNAWTGISIVNPAETWTRLTFMAMDDSGNRLDHMSRAFAPHGKWVGYPEEMFSEDISDAAYLIYNAEAPVAGFQLTGQGFADQKMLDGLPALPVSGQDSLPGARNDYQTVESGQHFEPVLIDVLANDTDPDGGGLEIIEVQSDTGYFGISGDKKAIVFDLGSDIEFQGTVSCTYTVSDVSGWASTAVLRINVELIENRPPVAADDEFVLEGDDCVNAHNNWVSIDVLANDSDPDGDGLEIVSIQTNTGRYFRKRADNKAIEFQFPADRQPFTNEFQCVYTISDGNGGTDTATLTLNTVFSGGIAPF